jgi:phosphoglycolate phosphatase
VGTKKIIDGITTIVFDLDGTLLDTSSDIQAAVNFVRGHYALPPLSKDEVMRYVGLGVEHLMEHTVSAGASVPLDEARRLVVDRYSRHLLDNTRPYDGIEDLLKSLYNRYYLAVATNKPTELAVRSIDGVGFGKYFQVVVGPEEVGAGKPAPDMLYYIASKADASPREVLLVGDSPVDIKTARNFGCYIAAVTWGFSDKKDLKGASPDLILESPLKLLDHLGK